MVLESSNKVNELLDKKIYYSALKVIYKWKKKKNYVLVTLLINQKTLETLENDRLGQTTEYTFTKMLSQDVPVMQNTIKSTVTVELKEWLAR